MKKKIDNIVVVFICILISVCTVTLMYKAYEQRDLTKKNENLVSVDKGILESEGLKEEMPKEKEENVINDSDIIGSIAEMVKLENESLFPESLNDRPNYGDKISLEAAQTTAVNEEVQGNFDAIVKKENNLYAASGWGVSLEKPIEYMVFVDQEEEVIGIGVYGILRKGLTEALNFKQDIDNAGWGGYLMPKPASKKIFVLGKLKNGTNYVLLGSIELE